MFWLSLLHLLLCGLYIPFFCEAAHAGFHVQYPWGTRSKTTPERAGLQDYEPFCGDIIRNPQSFAGYSTTFLSFSGHPGDLVSVRYTQKRAPHSQNDFNILITSNVSITPSGQLCINIQMPRPKENPEYGVLLFEGTDPLTGKVKAICVDVKLKDIEALGEEHPAMCARNNETLIPMPDEFL